MTPQVVFKVVPKGERLVCRLGDGAAVPSMDSGWEVVARPKRESFVTWNGYGPVAMTLPILLEGFRQDRSVEEDVTTLYKMMRKVDKKNFQPSIISIAGPVPYTNLQWVITGIDPGGEIRRRSDGRRTRAFFNISLMEYVPADVMVTKKRSPAKDAEDRNKGKGENGGKNSSPKRYTVKKGDTLAKIAVQFLGSAGEWRKIAKVNNIRDPKSIKVGDVLRIPADDS